MAYSSTTDNLHLPLFKGTDKAEWGDINVANEIIDEEITNVNVVANETKGDVNAIKPRVTQLETNSAKHEAEIATVKATAENALTKVNDLELEVQSLGNTQGELSNLTTVAKDNLVNAINELKARIDALSE